MEFNLANPIQPNPTCIGIAYFVLSIKLESLNCNIECSGFGVEESRLALFVKECLAAYYTPHWQGLVGQL